MRQVTASVDIAAPADVVWSQIAEFRHWPRWGPTVRAVEADGDRVASGVRGRVQTPLGFWLPFEITEVDEGRSWTWRVAGVPATGHRVVANDSAGCRLEFTAPIVAAPYVAVLRAGLRRVRRLSED